QTPSSSSSKPELPPSVRDHERNDSPQHKTIDIYTINNEDAMINLFNANNLQPFVTSHLLSCC
ncbi:unnamed protein product, partial [Brassica oleracea var. botrytis]